MKFISSLIRHVLYSLVLLLAVLVLNFLLIQLAPGDPVQTIVGQMGGATPEIIAQIRAEYGLDKSLVAQLLTYIRRAAGGDLGKSFHYNEPVTKLILQRMGGTLLLTLSALVIAVIVGTILGVLSAQKPRGVLNQFVTVFSLIGYSAPVFWTGIMLLILLAYVFPIFPSFGMQTAGFKGSLWEHTWDVLRHLVLPAFTLASVYLALLSRLSRASMLDILVSDYIRTARAKGLRETVVVVRHALRNTLVPVLTIIGIQVGNMLAGSVIIETVFSRQGLGRLIVNGILVKDFPIVQGAVLITATIYVLVNLLVDVAYAWVDPRVHYG